jgi:hypothetical protein
MNPQNEISPLPSLDLPASPSPVAPAAAAGFAASATSDCLYQFAALAVGAFLLVTML